MDVDALLRKPSNKRTKVEPDNVIPSFKQMMDTADDESVFVDAAKQIGHVIKQLIEESFADKNYDRAIENMGVFREYMINYEEPKLYNDFAKELKNKLLSGALGGKRTDFWYLMKGARMGMIDSSVSEVSKVTPEEASEVGLSRVLHI